MLPTFVLQRIKSSSAIDLFIVLSCIYTLRASNRADFVSWWMWFNGSQTKAQRHFCHEVVLLHSYVYNMHQDTKSARLIAVFNFFVAISNLSVFVTLHVTKKLQHNVENDWMKKKTKHPTNPVLLSFIGGGRCFRSLINILFILIY